MELVVAAISFVFLCWLVIKVGAYWYARRPWTIESARLDQSLGGLMNFGQSGAYLSLTNLKSQDRLTFTKHVGVDSEPDHLDLEVSSSGLTSEVVEGLLGSLRMLEARVPWELTEPWSEGRNLRIRLHYVDPYDGARIESVARTVVRELGHLCDERYKIDFKGPADYKKVSAYYGWRR